LRFQDSVRKSDLVYFDICRVACVGKNKFSLKTELRAVLVFQRFEELSVSICAEATSKFLALNEAVFGLEGRF